VVEEGGCPPARVGPPPAELRPGGRVEGASGDAVAHAECGQAPAQLARRPAGEGEGEHVAGQGRPGGGPVSDAAGEHAGLARSGARQDAERRGVGDHRLELGGVEPVEQRMSRSTRHERVVGGHPGEPYRGGVTRVVDARFRPVRTRLGPEQPSSRSSPVFSGPDLDPAPPASGLLAAPGDRRLSGPEAGQTDGAAVTGVTIPPRASSGDPEVASRCPVRLGRTGPRIMSLRGPPVKGFARTGGDGVTAPG
jgi:hypothetical protein